MRLKLVGVSRYQAYSLSNRIEESHTVYLSRYCKGRFVSEHRSEMVTDEEILHHNRKVYKEHLVDLDSDLTREVEEVECYCR
jgi:hypothetical protein